MCEQSWAENNNNNQVENKVNKQLKIQFVNINKYLHIKKIYIF